MQVINELIEVILYTRNMNRMVRFYRDILGLPVSEPDDVSDFSDETWVTIDAGTCLLTLYNAGARRPSTPPPTLPFTVRDIEATRTDLLSRNVRVTDIQEIAPGLLICTGKDPEGNLFTLEQSG